MKTSAMKRLAILLTVSFSASGVAITNANAATTVDPNASVEPANPRLLAAQFAAYTALNESVLGNGDSTAGFSSTFVLGQPGGRIVIHRKAGAITPMNAATDAAISSITSTGISVAYDSVHYSLSDLNPIYTAMPDIPPFNEHPNRYMKWEFDPDSNTIRIGVNGLRPGEDAAASTLYGGRVQVYETPAVKLYSANPCAPQNADCRVNDVNPYYGGDLMQITTSGGACTTSFAISTPNGPFMLTAGHCVPAGQVGTGRSYLYGPQLNKILGVVSYSYYQQSETNGEVNYDIAALRPAGSFLGRVWVGGTVAGITSGHSNTTLAYGVAAAGSAPAGTMAYMDGAKSGQHRVITFGNPFCDNDPKTNCGIQNTKPWTTGDNICQGGDSGGPVWIYNGSGLVSALGIIKGGDGTNCGYTTVQAALGSGNSIMTGTFPG